MPLQLTLTATDNPTRLVAHLGNPDQPLGTPTPLAGLPRLENESNPFVFNPIQPGQILFEAMGGQTLLTHLEQTDDRLLLLLTDAHTAALPWEYAVLPNGDLLGRCFGLLRLLPAAPAARPAPAGPLNLAVLAADPLVDQQGQPIPAYRRFGPAPAAGETHPRLNLEDELQAIRHTLARSDQAVTAQHVPPTENHLGPALRRGPAILHLSCHGSVIEQSSNGRLSFEPVLALEDEHGQLKPLRGDRLTHLPPPGVLRLVVLSACRTAMAEDANLARALVLAGSAPAAIGMQGDFPDPASAAFAADLYDSLLLGLDLAESLRQARHRLPDGYAGLPVAYVTRQGWLPLALQSGSPNLAGLDAARRVNLPASLTPPSPFVGREAELHHLARALAQNPVVTIVGQGGIGKTALAAALAARFAWRWPGGVIGFSLADLPDEFSPETVINGLLARLLGEAAALALAGLPAERQTETLLAETRQRRPLILIDNYETVLQRLDPASPDEIENRAEGTPAQSEIENRKSKIENPLRLHRLVARLAEAGLNLLLTSRQHPAGLAHEAVFPPDTLPGLTVPAGAELFLRHSSRAKSDPTAHRPLTEQVAAVTAGHPLAITLLAGEFDLSREQNPANFLQHWDDELAAARRAGAAAHHETFAVAFARSFQALSPAQQDRLAALGRFGAPFFAQGAALLWGLAEADLAQPDLNELVRRSLLAVDATYTDDTPATYRLEPVILSHLRRRRQPLPVETDPAYAAYADWLVNRCYGETGGSIALARLVRLWLDELVGQAESQPAESAAGYCWRLAWLLRQYGRLDEALRLLAWGQAAAQKQDDQTMLSNLWYEQAGIMVIRGDVEGALKLYTDSLDLNEKLGDLQGKAATLHAMAYIVSTRGDFEGALKLYTDSLDLNEKLGDLQGKAATLHAMAYIFRTRGDFEGALKLYTDSLDLNEKLGDLQGKAATLHAMAYIVSTRGDFEGALKLYTDSLDLNEKLGDLRGKAATLHEMAYIVSTRGDFEGALKLYTDSLDLNEKLGDLRGKAATLHEMAYIFRTRGDVEGALKLYTDSLDLKEKLGDLQGKAATLHEMAYIFRTRGDVEGALKLYTDSLDLNEKLGDLQGKAATLHEMAYIVSTRGDFEGALKLYTDSLDLNEKLGDLQGKAATLHAMAYIFRTRGDFEGALKLYTDSLDINEKLGDLRGKGATLSELASLYMTKNNWSEAERLSQQSLIIAQQLNSPGDAAFEYVKLGQVAQARGDLAQARARYQEGLAVFERLGMPREAGQVRGLLAGLEGGNEEARERRGMGAEEHGRKEQRSGGAGEQGVSAARLRAELAAQIEAALPHLPPEQQAQARQFKADLARMSEAELLAYIQRQAREQIEQQAEAVVEAALTARRDGQVAVLLPQLEQAAAHWAEGEASGSPYANLAQFTRAVVALLQGRSPEPVAPEYVTRLASLRQQLT